jgi:hypothetical protein
MRNPVRDLGSGGLGFGYADVLGGYLIATISLISPAALNFTKDRERG